MDLAEVRYSTLTANEAAAGGAVLVSGSRTTLMLSFTVVSGNTVLRELQDTVRLAAFRNYLGGQGGALHVTGAEVGPGSCARSYTAVPAYASNVYHLAAVHRSHLAAGWSSGATAPCKAAASS